MTHTVTFPGLGLEFTINRVAFSIFGHNIYWYGIIIAAGFLLAVAYCYRKAAFFGVDKEKLVDMLFFAVPLSIIGARIYYVLFYLDLYRRSDGTLDWAAMLRIWDGGIAIYGAVIAGIITVIVYCRVRKQPVWCYMDVGCYGLLIGQLIGRWGNFMNVEAYGGETTLPWRMGIEVVVNGVTKYMEVHPTFLYESLWNLAGFLLLILVAKWRKCDGQIFLLYIIWYGVGRSMIEGLRTDSLYFFGLTFFGAPIRTSQMLGIVSAVAAFIILMVRLKTGAPMTPALAPNVPEGQEKDQTEEDEHHGGNQD